MGQNKKRKNKKGKSRVSESGTSNESALDFDALIEEQINGSQQSHSSISQMLQNKIAEIEQSQKRKENAAFFKKNMILQRLEALKEEECAKEELYAFMERVNDIFYDVV